MSVHLYVGTLICRYTYMFDSDAWYDDIAVIWDNFSFCLLKSMF